MSRELTYSVVPVVFSVMLFFAGFSLGEWRARIKVWDKAWRSGYNVGRREAIHDYIEGETQP